MKQTAVVFILALLATSAAAQERPRARDAGLEVGIFPTGTLNAITDVDGVRVGHGHGHVVDGQGLPAAGHAVDGDPAGARVQGEGGVAGGAVQLPGGAGAGVGRRDKRVQCP